MRYDIALTVGCFDMLHEGHVNLFNKLIKSAPVVEIGIHDDYSIYQNKDRFPVQNYDHRVSNMTSWFLNSPCESFHFYCLEDADPSLDLSARYSESDRSIVFIRGNDWKDFPGRGTVKKFANIEFISYTEGMSSTRRREELNARD